MDVAFLSLPDPLCGFLSICLRLRALSLLHYLQDIKLSLWRGGVVGGVGTQESNAEGEEDGKTRK